MKNGTKTTSSRYRQIAVDIASKIVNGHYGQGDRVYARSALASQYGVSAETARRAICVLADMGIVETTKGSGIVIKSSERAAEFVKQHSDIQTVNDLKREILDSVERQAKENEFLKACIGELLDKTSRFQAANPFAPFEIFIDDHCVFLGKTAAEINFWHNTEATIVAIRRNGSLLMSPGPYATFTKGDIFYMIGDETCPRRVQNYLYP